MIRASVAELNAVLQGASFLKPYGFSVVSCAVGECVLQVPFDPAHQHQNSQQPVARGCLRMERQQRGRSRVHGNFHARGESVQRAIPPENSAKKGLIQR
jgi:hypothetical protein